MTTINKVFQFRVIWKICPPCPSSSPKVCPNSCPLHQRCHPSISFSDTLFSFCPQSFPASGFFPMNWLICIRWPKYWSFSFSISPSIEYSGLISFKIDWFDLFAVQWTLKSLLQHRSSKVSILNIIHINKMLSWKIYLFNPISQNFLF